MSSADKNKPPGKPTQRSSKAKPANKKPDQRQRPKPDRLPDRQQDEKELIEATVAPTETFPIAAEASTGAPSTGTAVALTGPPSKGELVPIDTFPIAAVAPVDIFLIGFQAIANAYREQARRSIEQTIYFVEKFTAVRSLDKAVEVQTEFAKEACETLVADSHRIWRLYSELARQVLRPFERLMSRVTQTAR
jgi:phasin family protein